MANTAFGHDATLTTPGSTTVTAYSGNLSQAEHYDANTAEAAILHIEATGIVTFTPKVIMF